MEKQTNKIDAAGQALGRIAVQAAVFLRGKQKADFLRHIDSGGEVEIFNIDKIKFTGKKLKQKRYWRHSGYLGGISSRSLEERLKKDAAKLVRDAVYGMLPKNKTRDKVIKRLKVHKGVANN